ncbi:uncharacterized protein BJ212DRAFT_539209 [Suillus subaureus]|uniref:Uncharacterized protein n=1 Tax=Suillus subaureus TaxID=48587 RepID=A0A9P7ELA8_9AGAM|nr:uncharacterized protein BJ212DRAFT_539209 [Suillus subaureus]KAG1824612.1 hypothetical protein BJ212DRAFT_539209 [Suillus subaureus]
MLLLLCLLDRSCSAAVHQLAESLWAQFQTVLWAYHKSDLDKDRTAVRRRVWDLTDVICRMFHLGLSHPPSPRIMWNLETCRKIHSRARSSERNDRHPSAALLKVQRFRFAVDADQS